MSTEERVEAKLDQIIEFLAAIEARLEKIEEAVALKTKPTRIYRRR